MRRASGNAHALTSGNARAALTNGNARAALTTGNTHVLSSGNGRAVTQHVVPLPSAARARRSWYGSAVRLLPCLLVLAACTPPIADALRDARAASEPPATLELRWEERGGNSLGAREIVVNGDGRVALSVWRPGFASGDPTSSGRPSGRPDTSATHRASTAQIHALLELLLELEAWDQQVDDDLPDPSLDRGRAWLKLRVGGASSEVWEHHADLEATGRLVRVREALEALLARSPEEHDASADSGEAYDSEDVGDDVAEDTVDATDPGPDEVVGADRS